VLLVESLWRADRSEYIKGYEKKSTCFAMNTLIKLLAWTGVTDKTPVSVYESRVSSEIKRLGDLMNDCDERTQFVATEDAEWARVKNDDVYKFYLNDMNNTSYAALKSSQAIDRMRLRYMSRYAKRQCQIKLD
jgi:hypothetical protein